MQVLLERALDISADSIRSSLEMARTLFPVEWIETQKTKKFSDPLFCDGINLLPQAQINRALREGAIQKELMHPLAEAILGTEKILEYFDRTGTLHLGLFSYRLFSLRDVAVDIDKVQDARDKLPKLMEPAWKSYLYELLVACAFLKTSFVEMLGEKDTPTPDMKIDNVFFLECKAKTAQEESVSRFRALFMRNVLDKIFQEAAKIGDSLLIKIDVHDHGSIEQIPEALRTMFSNKLTRKSTPRFKINIKPFNPGPFSLPNPMKVFGVELWRWYMNFDEWRDWHLIQPYGEFTFERYSNYLVSDVRRPILVCVRSTALTTATQNVWKTISEACRRQLKNHNPGAIRVLVSSDLYGIGANADPNSIKIKLDQLSLKLMKNYSRLDGIRFDIVAPPPFGDSTQDVGYCSTCRTRVGALVDFSPLENSSGIILI
jgi:hypothetical protein